jgi:hypothetical protein
MQKRRYLQEPEEIHVEGIAFIFLFICKDNLMTRNTKPVSASEIIISILVLLSAVAIKNGYVGNGKWYSVLFVTMPLLILAILNIHLKKHAILIKFHIAGYLRLALPHKIRYRIKDWIRQLKE